MHQRRNIQKFNRQILTASVIAILLLITPGFAQTAQADDSGLMVTAQDFSHRIAEVNRSDQQFQNSVDDTYNTFLRSVKRTQEHFKSRSRQRVAEIGQSSRKTAQAIGFLVNNANHILNSKGSQQQNHWAIN